MNEEMKEALKEYLKEHLTVEVDVGYDWGDRVVRVDLLLDGEKFSSGWDNLPTPSINY